MVTRSPRGPAATGASGGGRSRQAGESLSSTPFSAEPWACAARGFSSNLAIRGPSQTIWYARRAAPRQKAELYLVLCLGVLTAVGCSAPSPKCQAVDEGSQLCITPEDLGVPANALAGYGWKMLESEPTIGRFPVGVSVARVAATASGDGSQRCLSIAESTTESTVRWMHLWDDQPRIREVTRLRTLGLDPRGVTYEDLLRESANINCQLCLIHAQVEETEADAEYIAVLWDTVNRKPLAAFRIPAVISEEVREMCAKGKDAGRVNREAEAQAESDLRTSVRDAMWDLVHRDQAVPTTQPNPWMDYDYLPVFPRDYDRWQRILDLQRKKESQNKNE